MSKYLRSRSERKRLKRMVRKYSRKATGCRWQTVIGSHDEQTKDSLKGWAGFYKGMVETFKKQIQAEK